MTDTINSVTVVSSTDGATFEYDGPFNFIRDGGHFEVPIPVDPDDYAGIHETTAENLSEREGDILIARADDRIEGSGTIEAADVIEDDLVIRVDDAAYVDPSEVDIDRSELDV